MTPDELSLSKMDIIESQCRPAHFGEILRLIVELRDLIPAFEELDKASRVWVVDRFRGVARNLMSCVNEAYSTGLLKLEWDNEQVNDLQEFSRLLFRALERPDLRAKSLACLLYCCVGVASSSSLAHDPTEVRYWEMLLAAVEVVPALAKLAAGQDISVIYEVSTSRIEQATSLMAREGFEPIDPHGAINLSLFRSWAAWIEASQVSGPERLLLLERAASNTRLALNFMLLPETTPWPLGPLIELREGMSMTAMVHELGRQRLRALTANEPDVERFWPLKKYLDVHHRSPLHKQYDLRVGIVKKRRYIVTLPDLECFSSEFTRSKLAEWDRDPLKFMRTNMGQIPGSLRAQRFRIDLDTFEREIRDAALQEWFAARAEDVAPEALALVIVESTGLPHAATLPLGFFFRRIAEHIRKHVT